MEYYLIIWYFTIELQNLTLTSYDLFGNTAVESTYVSESA